MATTTNYGWTTPDDTALVKDGAAAIRTLGSSIDSTLKTQIDAQIPDSLLTTKGDIIAATGASTPARLGVGANGEVLVADSTASTGMKWAVPAAGSLTLLSTTTMSGTSTTVSGINQSYANLVIVASGFYGSNAQGVTVEPNGVSNPFWIGGFKGTGNDRNAEFTAPNMQTTATSLSNITLEIKRYATTSYSKPVLIYGSSRPDYDYNFMMGGVISSTSAISSIKFTSAFVGTFSGGQIAIYGVN
jgi:hypothetical protein